MLTNLPGTEATGGAADRVDQAANQFALRDLVSLYQQQGAAVNQLWAMYAATTFAAGLFAFNVGGNNQAAILLIAGALGFLFFTVGHGFMVYHGVKRMQLAAEDITCILATSQADIEAKSYPKVVHYLAGKVRTDHAVIVHVLIDACVFAMFAVQLWRLGWL